MHKAAATAETMSDDEVTNLLSQGYPTEDRANHDTRWSRLVKTWHIPLLLVSTLLVAAVFMASGSVQLMSPKVAREGQEVKLLENDVFQGICPSAQELLGAAGEHGGPILHHMKVQMENHGWRSKWRSRPSADDHIRIQVPCGTVPAGEVSAFHAFYGAEAILATCRYDCDRHKFTLEPKEQTHWWTIGAPGEDCTATCAMRGGCASAADQNGTWPQDEEAMRAVMGYLRYPCKDVVKQADGSSAPALEASICKWQARPGMCDVGREGAMHVCPCAGSASLSHPATRQDVFAHLDLDKSGFVEPWEGMRFASDPQVNEMFEKLDTNIDGKISKAEMLEVLERLEDEDNKQLLAEIRNTKKGDTTGRRLHALSPFLDAVVVVASDITNSTVSHPTYWAATTRLNFDWGKQCDDKNATDLLPKGGEKQPEISYTFTNGAPSAMAPELENPASSDGCFPGMRVVNQDSICNSETSEWAIFTRIWCAAVGIAKYDVVAWIATAAGYGHIAMDVALLDLGKPEYTTFYACSKGDHFESVPDPNGYLLGALLHFQSVYVQGIQALRSDINENAAKQPACDTAINRRQRPGCTSGCKYSYMRFDYYCTHENEDVYQWCELCTECESGWQKGPECPDVWYFKGVAHFGCALAREGTDEEFGWCSADKNYTGKWHMCRAGCETETPSVNKQALHLQNYSSLLEKISYKDASKPEDVKTAIENAREFGWKVVGKASSGEDKLRCDPTSTWLLQRPEVGHGEKEYELNNECILTFQGTETSGDWWNNAQFIPTAFCGFLDPGDSSTITPGHGVAHTGFVLELERAVMTNEFQKNIRPKLQHCSRLKVFGHSLGGAMANLFTACVNKAPKAGDFGFNHYAYMGFAKGVTKPLDEIQ